MINVDRRQFISSGLFGVGLATLPNLSAFKTLEEAFVAGLNRGIVLNRISECPFYSTINDMVRYAENHDFKLTDIFIKERAFGNSKPIEEYKSWNYHTRQTTNIKLRYLSVNDMPTMKWHDFYGCKHPANLQFNPEYSIFNQSPVNSKSRKWESYLIGIDDISGNVILGALLAK